MLHLHTSLLSVLGLCFNLSLLINFPFPFTLSFFLSVLSHYMSLNDDNDEAGIDVDVLYDFHSLPPFPVV